MIFLDINGCIIIPRIEPSVDFYELLQNRAVDGFKNQDDESKVLVQQLLSLPQEFNVLVVEHAFWWQVWQIVRGTELHIIDQPLMQLFKVFVSFLQYPNL